jgi:alpha-mannosidase
MGMMDQSTTGHLFLKETLGIVPRTAWQLDPFGHSQTQASLMTARAGFDALYFGRIDYQDMALRKQTQDCEGLWDTTPLGDGGSGSRETTVTTIADREKEKEAIFWGLTGSYRGNYGPPDDSFLFDVLYPDSEPLVGANTSRLLERMEMLLKNGIRTQAQQTRGQHIMLTMGTDFTYQDAFIDFVSVT